MLNPNIRPAEPEASPGRVRRDDPSGGGLLERLRSVRVPTNLVSSLVAFVIFCLIWEVFSRFIIKERIILVGPIEAMKSMWKTFRSGELWHHAKVSGKEFLIGFAIGSVIGVPLGLLIGAFPRAKRYIDPMINGLYATPLIALAPLFILWFGLGEKKTIILIIILVVLPVAINTDVGVRSTDPVLMEVAQSYGATRLQRFKMVEVPWSLSFIVSGLRLGIGRGLMGVVVGELFGSRAGLGFMILTASQVFDTPKVLGGVLLFAVVGVGVVMLMEWLERLIAPWRYR